MRRLIWLALLAVLVAVGCVTIPIEDDSQPEPEVAQSDKTPEPIVPIVQRFPSFEERFVVPESLQKVLVLLTTTGYPEKTKFKVCFQRTGCPDREFQFQNQKIVYLFVGEYSAQFFVWQKENWQKEKELNFSVIPLKIDLKKEKGEKR